MGITLSYNGLGGKVKFSGTSGRFRTSYIKPFLLDLYPNATVAYSLRKLRATYTGSAIRVRRSSDNAEQNIGFVNGVLDTASLLSFTGAGNSFVTIWYDQSGNANNAIQASAASQPIIVSSAALILRNSKPYLQASSTQFLRFTTDLTTTTGNSYSFWMTYEKDTTTGNQAILIKDGGQYHWLDYQLTQYIGNLDGINISSRYEANTVYINNTITNFTVGATIYRNGASIGTKGALNQGAVSSYLPSDGFRTAKITMSEFVFYPSNQETNRVGISTNINSYYTIYAESTIDADAQAFFTRVTTAGGILTATEQTAVNTLTLSLKAAGIWSKMRAIYPMVGASLPACSQNLKSSSYIGIFSGTWTYASTGITAGAGASLEVPLNLNVMNSINDISYGYYCRNDVSSIGSFGWGVGGGINNEFWIKYTDNNRYGYIFDSANDGGAAGDSRGLNSISRIASNTKYIQKNATITAYSSVSSGTLASRNFNFAAGSQGIQTTRENAFGFIADGLTSINLSDLYNAVQAFQITLSRQV